MTTLPHKSDPVKSISNRHQQILVLARGDRLSSVLNLSTSWPSLQYVFEIGTFAGDKASKRGVFVLELHEIIAEIFRPTFQVAEKGRPRPRPRPSTLSTYVIQIAGKPTQIMHVGDVNS